MKVDHYRLRQHPDLFVEIVEAENAYEVWLGTSQVGIKILYNIITRCTDDSIDKVALAINDTYDWECLIPAIRTACAKASCCLSSTDIS